MYKYIHLLSVTKLGQDGLQPTGTPGEMNILFLVQTSAKDVL